MRERVVAMGKEEGKRNPVAQEGTRRYCPPLSLSLSRVLDLLVYRSTVQAEPDSRRDKGRAVRVSRETVPAVSAGNYQPRAKDGNGIVR